MADDTDKKLLDAIEKSTASNVEDSKGIRKDIETQTAVLGNAIMNLQKQGKDQNIKDSKIGLKENLGSLLEVQATFKAQRSQMEYEKKENIDQVDDILGRKTKEDRKWYGSMLDFMRKGDKTDENADAQQTEKIKKENSKSKMEFKTLSKISKATTGMLKSMTQWDKLKGAAKFTFFGALMAGFMVGLIKFLDTQTWKDFRSWVFSPTGLTKQLADWGMSWTNMYNWLFATDGGGPAGAGSGPFQGPEGKKMGFFPFVGAWLWWLGEQLVSWASGVMTLFKDLQDKMSDKPGAKSWKQILLDAFDILWHPGLGVFAVLAGLFLPKVILKGMWHAGKWLFYKPLVGAIKLFGSAIKGLYTGLTFASGAAAGAGLAKGALKPGSVNAKTGRLVGVTGRDTTVHQSDKGFKDAQKKVKGLVKRGGPERALKAAGKFKNLFKVARGFWPLSMIIGSAQGIGILMDDNLSHKQKIHALGGVVGQTLGAAGFGALGAVIGSAIPGLGTLVGAVTGGLIGAYGGEWAGRELMGYLMGEKPDEEVKEFAKTFAQHKEKAAIPSSPKGENGINSLRKPITRGEKLAGGAGQTNFLKNKARQEREAEINATRKHFGKIMGGEPPRPVMGDKDYRTKWIKRNQWLRSRMRDAEPYLREMPKNYMSHLNDNQARALYGGSVYRPSAEDMWRKDNERGTIYNAPTNIDSKVSHYTLNGMPSGSPNASTIWNLKDIRQ